MKFAKSKLIKKSKTNSRKLSLLRILFFLVAVVLVRSDATDADLADQEIVSNNLFSTTTLDFSQRNTANNQPISTLFNTTGFLPDGFDVKSVRIKKDGQSDFSYKLSFQKTLGDDNLCQGLKVDIMTNWQITYQGKLTDLDTDYIQSDFSDLIILISLDQDDPSLKNLFCDFNFVFKTINNYPSPGGFWDEEILSNHISSGIW